MAGAASGPVCVVTVTYGDRFHLLRQVVEAALREEVDQVVIVDNAASPASAEGIAALAEREGGVVRHLRNERNLGSAGGYKAGLRYALESTKCEFIWLLDDDNRPDPGALAPLREAHDRLLSGSSPGALAMLSLRPDRDHLVAIARGRDSRLVYPRRSSFLGFHLLDLPRKVRRLVAGGGASGTRGAFVEAARVPFGPYGGLFLHRETLLRIGYPDEELFVYGDDTEYTYRITASGDSLYLIPASRITDLESSWRVKYPARHSIAHLLESGSDSQVYYTVRNNVHFYRRNWSDSPLLLRLNKWIFLSILLAFAIWWRKRDRLALILRAIRDGESGQLGIR